MREAETERGEWGREGGIKRERERGVGEGGREREKGGRRE